MGYQGGGLGILGQGTIQPLEVARGPQFEGIGYGSENMGGISQSTSSKEPLQ